MPTPSTNWKEATDTNAGNAAIYGAPDVKRFSQLYNGVLNAGDVDINSNFFFRDNKFFFLNPARDFSYVIRTSAIIADREITIPLLTANDTMVLAAFIQTLTNKTINLANNTLSGTLAEFNTALSDADFASLAGSETLTNKTVNLSSNTLSGTKAQFDTALSDDNFAYLAAHQTFTGRMLHSNRHELAKGADVASAGTLTVGDDGNYFDITGTTTINYITTTNWQAGSRITLQFDGSLTVTHNAGSAPADTAAIFLAAGANFAASAGKTLTLTYDGVYWRETGGAGGGGGSDTPWTVNHDFDTYYFDMQTQTAPSSPATDNGRFYVKTIDSNNQGFFVKIKKNGAFEEVQIA